MSSAPTSLRFPTDYTRHTKAMSDKLARFRGPAGSNWVIACLPCEHAGVVQEPRPTILSLPLRLCVRFLPGLTYASLYS